MKLNFFTLLMLIFYSTFSFAQISGFEYAYCLKEVHFSGEEGINYITIRKDDNSGDYLAPQLVQENTTCAAGILGTITTQHPVAYVSGTNAKVKAIFETDCTAPLYIRGFGPEIGEGNDAQELFFFDNETYTPVSGMIETGEIVANLPFILGKVKYWENFTIQWQMSASGADNTWTDIGESVNAMYVTYKQPESISTNPVVANGDSPEGTGFWLQPKWGYKWFHTLLKVSCEAAKDLSSDQSIIDAVWAKLQTRSIVAADNNMPLFYDKTEVKIIDETAYDLDGDGMSDDFNGDGVSEEGASVFVILIATNKDVAQLIQTEGSTTNY